MKPRELPFEPELEALLNPRKIERRAPPDVRARALARGRAFVAAGGRIAPLSSLQLAPPPLPLPPPPKLAAGNALVRTVLPASFAAAAVAIGAVAALRSSPARPPTLVASAQATAAPIAPSVEDTAITPQVAETPVVVLPKPARNTRPDAELGTTELELLARAQAAYTRRDFTRAIALVGELSRKFPNGHLAEEREALRVRSLLGAGRAEEGQRAAAAFAVRFPRSVLLPKEAKLEGKP